MDALIARIIAHRSDPETYDPPSAEALMDRVLADAGRKAAARYDHEKRGKEYDA